MISVQEAAKIVAKKSVSTNKVKAISLIDALDYILAENVHSPINMPPFRQSAMDGYALNLHENSSYALIGEVKAGDNYHPKLKEGEAVRIFTGAPVPDTANAVVMQERTSVNYKTLSIETEIEPNANIRPCGEQVHKNQVALKKGTKLTPAAIAFLTSLGITCVKVYIKPSITIVVTGNELVQAGQTLEYGQIYESNAMMLRTALKKQGYHKVSTQKVGDNYEDTLKVLEDVIANNDVVLISGGISVGDYDFVGKVLLELGTEKLFYKVRQKPGKPLFFGKKDEKLIFALPGNPAAALSCFYIYVLSALEKLSGNASFTFHKTKAICRNDFTKRGDRAQFLKAIYDEGKVEILEGQSSAMLHTFALANALVYLSEASDSVKKDDKVDVILLPIH